jgi:AAA15 family ATPase/GTPase
MDTLDCDLNINLHLIRKFFTNDISSLLPVVKKYETHYNGDMEKLKISFYINKMMIFLLEILDELNKKADKETIKKLLINKCDNKYALYTQTFDFFTEIQSVITTYNQKRNNLKDLESDIDLCEIIEMKVRLSTADNTKKEQSKTHLILNKSLV